MQNVCSVMLERCVENSFGSVMILLIIVKYVVQVDFYAYCVVGFIKSLLTNDNNKLFIINILK